MGNYSSQGEYLDRSNEVGGRWVAPTMLVRAVEALQQGSTPMEVYRMCDGKVTLRTIFRWRKSGNKRRYLVSKWYLENRDRLNTLASRGLFWIEIAHKVGLPEGIEWTNYRSWWLKHTVETMEMAENDYWADVAA
jgi:hypothetical protein